MERFIYFVRTHPLQVIFGLVMIFIFLGIVSGFMYISQPEQNQQKTTSRTAPTAVPVPAKVTKESAPGISFTQEEQRYPTGAPESNSDYSHTGGLVITSNPSSATITLSLTDKDGTNPVSYSTPLRTTGLRVGEYTLTATKTGYRPATTTIFIREGETTRINIELTSQ